MDFAKLTRYDATFRSDSLQIDSYELDLDLGEATTSPTFPVEVGVKLTSKSEQIFLDYLGESVESVTINGNPVPWEQKGGRIVLDVPAGLVGRPIALQGTMYRTDDGATRMGGAQQSARDHTGGGRPRGHRDV